MAPGDAPWRSPVNRADPRLATYGAAAILIGILIALLVDAPALRFLGSVTAIVIGFGLIRQAFRIE
jgi:hypothetical protein